MRRAVIASFALVLGLFLCAALSAAKDDDAVACYNRGKAYYDKGDFAHAIQEFAKAIELKADYADAYCGRGNAYLGRGEIDGAIEDYTKAIELKPKDALGYFNRGLAYGEKGDYDRSIQDFTKAIELKPDATSAYRRRGAIYARKGDGARAIQDFTKALGVNPADEYACRGRGLVYLNDGQYDLAIGDLSRLIELKPDDAVARVRLFLAKERLGQDGRTALAEWRKGLKEGEWMSQVVRMLLGEITPEQLLVSAADADPKSDAKKKCAGHYYVGQFYYLRGEKDRARESFTKCVATGATNAGEYFSAQAELKRLEKPKP